MEKKNVLRLDARHFFFSRKINIFIPWREIFSVFNFNFATKKDFK